MLSWPPQEYSLAEEERLSSLGADFVRSDRGGLITFHGPGQLIAYPVLNLNNFGQNGAPMGKCVLCSVPIPYPVMFF